MVVCEVKHAVPACFCHVIVSQQKLSTQKHNMEILTFLIGCFKDVAHWKPEKCQKARLFFY